MYSPQSDRIHQGLPLKYNEQAHGNYDSANYNKHFDFQSLRIGGRTIGVPNMIFQNIQYRSEAQEDSLQAHYKTCLCRGLLE